MGFFGALGNIMAGKPVFGPDNTTSSAERAPQQDGGSTEKVVPVVRVTRVESPINGNRLDVNLEFRNESPVEVWLTRITLLGVSRGLSDDLKPGQSAEIPVYSGPIPPNDSHRDAEVEYRTMDGEYFAARHEVHYQQQSDGLHVYQLKLITPIKELR
jgi:hypothetical protein